MFSGTVQGFKETNGRKVLVEVKFDDPPARYDLPFQASDLDDLFGPRLSAVAMPCDPELAKALTVGERVQVHVDTDGQGNLQAFIGHYGREE